MDRAWRSNRDAKLVGHPCHHDRWEGPLRSRCEGPPSSSQSIPLREPVPPVPRLVRLRLAHKIPRSFSRETGWSMSSHRRRRAVRHDGAGTPEMFSDPSFFSPRSGAVDRLFYPCITPCCLYRVDSVVNSPARLPVGPTDRVVRCPRPVMAGRRERRRPAEAAPLCETRRWTRLFRKFTSGAWERQAPPRGAPL